MVFALKDFAIIVDLRNLAASLCLVPTIERQMFDDYPVARPYPEEVLTYCPSQHKNLARSAL
jgi:hypothetical protein